MKFLLTITLLILALRLSAQNIGIDVINPTEKLHLNSGNIRLAGSDKGIMLNGVNRPMLTRAIDTFTSGANAGLGRWGLFMEPNKLVLGFPDLPGKSFELARYNANSSSSPVFSVNANGAIALNGDPGTAGQVFTSNGNAAAEWRTLSVPSVRFATTYSTSFSGEGYAGFSANPRYVIGDIQYFTDSIVFPIGGLYQFNLFYYTRVSTSVAPAAIPTMSMELRTGIGASTMRIYPFMNAILTPMNNNSSTASSIFHLEKNVSFSVNVPAGHYIKIFYDLNASNITGRSFNSLFTGHLISQ